MSLSINEVVLPVARMSELQPGATGAIGQSRDAAVVLVAATVEDDRGDPSGLGALGAQLADELGLGALVAVGRTQVRREGRRGGHGLADRVVHHLHGDVPRGPGDDQARPLGSTDDLLAQTEVPPRARLGALLGNVGCHHLPVFPTLRRTTSPAYRTPLPLYGSGLRNLRMLAATSPTNCLSMPSTLNRIGDSTVKEIPSGALTGTGWE